jgi:hypothetical protein
MQLILVVKLLNRILQTLEDRYTVATVHHIKQKYFLFQFFLAYHLRNIFKHLSSQSDLPNPSRKGLLKISVAINHKIYHLEGVLVRELLLTVNSGLEAQLSNLNLPCLFNIRPTIRLNHPQLILNLKILQNSLHKSLLSGLS